MENEVNNNLDNVQNVGLSEGENLEKLEKNSSLGHGGARDGAGRKAGKVSDSAKYRQKKHNEIKTRIARAAHMIVNAQLSMARGVSYLFHTKWVRDRTGKEKRVTERIEDPEIIQQYLNGEFDDMQDEFYYITTKAPNNFALDSLLNRAFGKPKETVDVFDKTNRKKILVEIVDPRNNGNGNPETQSDNGVSEDMAGTERPESQNNP